MSRVPEPIARLHPNIAKVYCGKVADLTNALHAEASRAEASEAIRALIDGIRLVNNGDRIRIELYGEFAALITLTNQHPRSKESGVQTTLVAGARNYLDLLLTAENIVT